MKFLRTMLGWLFALSFAVCASEAVRLVLWALKQGSDGSHPLVRAEALVVFPVCALIFAVAWWSIWKERPSAKFWVIAAGLSWILIWLLSSLQFARFFWMLLAGGMVGVVVFVWRDKNRRHKGFQQDQSLFPRLQI